MSRTAADGGRDLKPMAPTEAVEMYLDTRADELSEKSLQNQRYRLQSFLAWCEDAGIDDLTELDGRDLHRFRQWRSQGQGEQHGEVSTVTLRGILQTLRVFLEFAAGIDAVEPGLREQVMLPEVSADEESSDEQLPADAARDILRYLERFHYASRDHIILAIFWHTGIRLGSIRALDVEDFDADERSLALRHRPESGTPLKNGQAAERKIALDEHYTQVVADYIRHNRDQVTDDHGRRPLITSEYGRLTEVPIRKTCYRWTRPCMIGGCPHDKEPETCEWMQDNDQASGCPSSRSPHGVRRGAITRMLREGVPEEVVTDRMNVSADVLDQHYDQRSETERMETRREFLEFDT